MLRIFLSVVQIWYLKDVSKVPMQSNSMVPGNH